jgi:uncharacterized membrane protein
LTPIADSPPSEPQKEENSKAEVPLMAGNAVNTPSARVSAANDVASSTEEGAANIAHPPIGSPLAKHSAKDETVGADIENYVSTGSVIVVVGALLFFFARQLSRKLFWWNRGFY